MKFSILSSVILFIGLINPVQSQYLTLNGVLPNKVLYNQLKIYKYHSSFERSYVGDIEIEKGKFTYQIPKDELDVYLIENPLNEHFVLFIWDNNITIEIDSVNFSNSKVKNSQLTNEMNTYGVIVQKTFFDPIHKIDTLISQYKISNKYEQHKPIIDSLMNNRGKLWDESQRKFNEFNKRYIIDHPDSFFSLFLLTKMCVFGPKDDDKALFRHLSDRLKLHNRGKVFK